MFATARWRHCVVGGRGTSRGNASGKDRIDLYNFVAGQTGGDTSVERFAVS
jgi:hypothetical protein